MLLNLQQSPPVEGDPTFKHCTTFPNPPKLETRVFQIYIQPAIAHKTLPVRLPSTKSAYGHSMTIGSWGGVGDVIWSFVLTNSLDIRYNP